MDETQAFQYLAQRLVELAHPAPEEALKGFHDFCGELLRWNRVHNLTGQRDPGGVVLDLFLDGLALAPYLGGGGLLDIGSGAGFPGLPLAIGLPDLCVTLLEPRAKRISFQRQVVRLLGLGGRVSPVLGRAGCRELAGASFGNVTLRAVANLGQSLKLAAPYVAAEGRVLLPRGLKDRDEALHLGLSAHTYILPNGEERLLAIARPPLPCFT